MIHPSVRDRLDQHIIAAQTIIYRTIAGGLYEVTPHWVRGLSGSSVPVFNVFLPRTQAGLTDDILADTEAFFSSNKSLYVIELIHDRFPQGPDFLTKRQYQPLPPQPAMFLEGNPGPVSSNPEVRLERVSTAPTMTAFCTILHQIFDFSMRDMVRMFPPAHLKETKISHYLAFVDERPVGAGTLICTGGVASIHNVCTLDDYRRRGVASTLVTHLLQVARAGGCDLTMLYSTPQAYHLFNRFGFEIYTQRQWFLPPGLDYEE